GLLKNAIDQIAPPFFIVIFARSVDRFSFRHRFPRQLECAIKLFGIQLQADLSANQGIMMADDFRQIKERADRIKKDRSYRHCLVFTLLRPVDVMDELRALPKWTQTAGEELANSISHGIGLVAALIGTPILVLAALQRGNSGFFIGTIVFAATLLLLYLGSTL